MTLILVSGIPASGKSTMAAYLSEKLDIPMYSKDRIKELLYDTVGFEGRAQKVKLGAAAPPGAASAWATPPWRSCTTSPASA